MYALNTMKRLPPKRIRWRSSSGHQSSNANGECTKTASLDTSLSARPCCLWNLFFHKILWKDLFIITVQKDSHLAQTTTCLFHGLQEKWVLTCLHFSPMLRPVKTINATSMLTITIPEIKSQTKWLVRTEIRLNNSENFFLQLAPTLLVI